MCLYIISNAEALEKTCGLSNPMIFLSVANKMFNFGSKSNVTLQGVGTIIIFRKVGLGIEV